jgi:hypothetical protein
MFDPDEGEAKALAEVVPVRVIECFSSVKSSVGRLAISWAVG